MLLSSTFTISIIVHFDKLRRCFLYQRFAYIRKMNYFCFKQVLKLGTMIQTLRVILVGLVVSLLSSTAFAQR